MSKRGKVEKFKIHITYCTHVHTFFNDIYSKRVDTNKNNPLSMLIILIHLSLVCHVLLIEVIHGY